jgi:hypothetical protein
MLIFFSQIERTEKVGENFFILIIVLFKFLKVERYTKAQNVFENSREIQFFGNLNVSIEFPLFHILFFSV